MRPPVNTSTLNKKLVIAAMPMQMRTLFLIRSYLPAPKFCPANVVMATPYAPIIIQKMPSILPYAVQAAIVSVPKALTLDWIIRLETEYMVDCTPAGRPSRIISCRKDGVKRISFTYSR